MMAPESADGGFVGDGDVPSGFQVRPPRALLLVLWTVTLGNAVVAAVSRDVTSIVLVIVLVLATLNQQSWRARIVPEGLRFENRMGVDWARDWSELRSGVLVRPPGRLGSLVRGRLQSGRRVSVPNGTVTTLSGAKVAPETARALMQGWADASAGGD